MSTAVPVDVWSVDLASADAWESRLAWMLTSDECERAGRMRVGRAEFVTMRAALRSIIAARLGEYPDDVRFSYGPHGKPAVNGNSDLHFSVSHTTGVGVVAVAEGERRVGVDVEHVQGYDEIVGVPEMCMSARELTELSRHRREEGQGAMFFNVWTQKEAIVKALGCGLSVPLRDVPSTLVRRPEEPVMAGAPAVARRGALSERSRRWLDRPGARPTHGSLACLARPGNSGACRA